MAAPCAPRNPQLESQATTTAGQEAIIPEQQLVISRYCLADAAEANHTKSPGQCQSIFDLCCNHVTSEVLARHKSSQLIAHAVYTVAIEGGLSTRCAKITVISKHLIFAQTPIFRESRYV
jgi:hypothetical protein